MKRIILLITVVVVLASCAGCGRMVNRTAKPVETTNTVSVTTASPTQVVTEEPTALPTEAPTAPPTDPPTEPPTEPLIDLSHPVDTAIESGNSRLPKILMNSDDAKAINEEIINNYGTAVYDDSQTFDYTYYINDHMLSVILGLHNQGGYYFSAWTIDTDNGERLENSEIMSAFSTGESDIVNAIRNAEDNRFIERFDKSWNDTIRSAFNDAYNQTMMYNNLSDFELAVGQSGLLAVIKEYTIAGQGESLYIVDINAEKTYDNIDELK